MSLEDIFSSEDFKKLDTEYQGWVKNMEGNKSNLKRTMLAAINFYLEIQEKNCRCLEPYKGTDTKINIRCNNDHINNRTPYNFLNAKNSCSDCSGYSSKSSKNNFIKVLKEKNLKLVRPELHEIKNCDQKIYLQCSNVEHQAFSTSIGLIIRKNLKIGCSRCSQNSSEQAFEDLQKICLEKELEILSNYQSSIIEMSFRCLKCLSEFSSTPRNIKRCKFPCKLCRSKNRMKYNSSEQSEKDFMELLNTEGYKLVDCTYINNSTPLSMQCPNLHPPQPRRPTDFKRGNRCSWCSNNNSEQCILKFKQLMEKERCKILNLNELKTIKSIAKIICPNNHHIEKSVNHLLNLHICNKCSNRSWEQSKEKFFDKLKELEYTLLSEYINSTTKVIIRCNEAHITYKLPCVLLSGKLCFECFGSSSGRCYKKMLAIVTSKKGKIIGEYSKNRNRIECAKSHKWLVSPPSIIRGS